MSNYNKYLLALIQFWKLLWAILNMKRDVCKHSGIDIHVKRSKKFANLIRMLENLWESVSSFIHPQTNLRDHNQILSFFQRIITRWRMARTGWKIFETIYIDIALYKILYNSVRARKNVSVKQFELQMVRGPGLGKSIPSKPPLVLCHPYSSCKVVKLHRE